MPVLATLALAATMACGGAPLAGPSPVAEPTPAGAAPAPLPAGLDPAYVRALARVDASGRPQRWEGGPMRHCFGPGVDVAVAQRVADRMAALSGIPRAKDGPCNVEWVIEPTPENTLANTTISGTATAIYRARIAFMTAFGSAHPGIARHEGGHVLGLGHSPRPGDLMRADYYDHTAGDFTADELALLAWMYGR